MLRGKWSVAFITHVSVNVLIASGLSNGQWLVTWLIPLEMQAHRLLLLCHLALIPLCSECTPSWYYIRLSALSCVIVVFDHHFPIITPTNTNDCFYWGQNCTSCYIRYCDNYSLECWNRDLLSSTMILSEMCH